MQKTASGQTDGVQHLGRIAQTILKSALN